MKVQTLSVEEYRKLAAKVEAKRSQARPRSSRERRRRTAIAQATQDAFTRIAGSELGVEVVREFRFHPTRRWRFDYAIPSEKVALEVEGGAFTQGRHTRGRGFINDMEKYNTAGTMGWQVFRVIPSELYSGKTMRMLAAAIEKSHENNNQK